MKIAFLSIYYLAACTQPNWPNQVGKWIFGGQSTVPPLCPYSLIGIHTRSDSYYFICQFMVSYGDFLLDSTYVCIALLWASFILLEKRVESPLLIVPWHWLIPVGWIAWQYVLFLFWCHSMLRADSTLQMLG